MKKFCTKCGHEFKSVGREVICPTCKAAAAEENKKAAVLRAKRASWTGESVPVRISGRASTVIRRYGAAHDLPFAAALDALLKDSEFFGSMDKAWYDITPYKSRRRDKHTTETENTSTTETAQNTASKPQDETGKQEVKAAGKPQEAPQDVQDEPVKPVKTAAKVAKTTSKASTSKAAGKAASKK